MNASINRQRQNRESKMKTSSSEAHRDTGRDLERGGATNRENRQKWREEKKESGLTTEKPKSRQGETKVKPNPICSGKRKSKRRGQPQEQIQNKRR